LAPALSMWESNWQTARGRFLGDASPIGEAVCTKQWPAMAKTHILTSR
jgi:hypothetical protein